MSFAHCIRSAVDQGAISPEQGDELTRRWEALREQATKDGKGAEPGGVDAAAREALAKEFDDAAARRKQLAGLSARVTESLAEHARGFRDAQGRPDVLAAFMGWLDNSNNVLAGTDGFARRIVSYQGYAYARFEQMLFEMRRTVGLGVRRGKATLEAIIAEAHGEASGNAAAREFLAAWRAAADELADRFNAAGGQLPKRARYFPQNHDSRRLAARGQEAWIAFIAPRLSDESREEAGDLLPAIWRRIVTDSAIEAEPSMQRGGRTALANRRQEERVLEFRDAAAWREYHAAFGQGSAYDAMMGHVKGLARDVAALETLGPNPDATVEWMRQVVRQQAAKAALGEDSLYRAGGDAAALRRVLGMSERAAGAQVNRTGLGRIDAGDDILDRLFRTIDGSSPTGNMAAADAMQAVRSTLQAALLSGAALTAALGDPVQQSIARAFAGVSQLRALSDLPRQLFSTAAKREVTRAGVVFADATEHLATQVRDLSLTAASNELAKWLPDRVFQWTGLAPLTKAERRAAAMSFMFEAGDRAGQTLAEMRADGAQGARFARWLEGFGVGEDDWDLIRAARPLEHGEAGGLLRMIDVIDAHRGDERAFQAALKYSAALHGFMESAVPEGSARVRARMQRGAPAGTLAGEFTRSATMFLSYPVNQMLSMVRATMIETGDFGVARGIGGFAIPALVGLTLAGAMMVQLGELRKGHDTREIDDKEFWALAFARGGALSFWGDYLLGDYKRGSADVSARIPGPVANFAIDAIGVINPRAALTQDETSRARLATRFGARYIPVQNMWWLKPATDRLLWDRLTRLADPDAERAWRRAERKLRSEHGQGVWWGPAESTPRRAPEIF